MTVQVIVCKNGVAGINFEHSTCDGHSVLRFASDVYARAVMPCALHHCADVSSRAGPARQCRMCGKANRCLWCVQTCDQRHRNSRKLPEASGNFRKLNVKT